MFFRVGCLDHVARCFNPCFSGFCSECNCGLEHDLFTLFVSILVLVDFVRNEKYKIALNLTRLTFQSLFYWIMFGMFKFKSLLMGKKSNGSPS